MLVTCYVGGCPYHSGQNFCLKPTVVNIDDCTFTSNVGINGGAIYANSDSDVTITNSEFTANEGTGSGGAIYANKLNIHNTAFIGNSERFVRSLELALSKDVKNPYNTMDVKKKQELKQKLIVKFQISNARKQPEVWTNSRWILEYSWC